MTPKPYGIVIQGTLQEFNRYPSHFDFIRRILQREAVRGVVVAVPSIGNDPTIQETLEKEGVAVCVGDDYNVALRVLNAHRSLWPEQTQVVRICSSWQLVDFGLVDDLVEFATRNEPDYVMLPKDFDYTAAADVASQSALECVSSMSPDSPAAHRAIFNPWSYLEVRHSEFRVMSYADVPTYPPLDVEKRLKEVAACYPENEFFGRDYAGSRYDSLLPEIEPEDIVLDLATGSGHGASVLSQKARFVLGVDYLQHYVDAARMKYPEHERLQFAVGDAQEFVHKGGGAFTVAVTLHTMEHLPQERGLLRTMRRNLAPQGRLILEVPLLVKRPWGRPTNPYHLREYSRKRVLELLQEEGFVLEKTFGGCRGLYFDDDDRTRGDFRVHVRKA